MKYTWMQSPIGDLLLAGEKKLSLVSFPEGNKKQEPKEGWVRDDSIFPEVRRQLAEYFSGSRTTFDLELEVRGTTFQKSVLQALQTIPFGQTRTYKDIAEQVGSPKAVRAVGAANGNNPIPIIIPCHRVIGSNGKLTGFGGGLPTKQYLLDLEQGRTPRFDGHANG